MTHTGARRLFNTRAIEIAGVFRYLSHSTKRSLPTNWNRITANVGFLRAADELLRDGNYDAATRWPPHIAGTYSPLAHHPPNPPPLPATAPAASTSGAAPPRPASPTRRKWTSS